MEKIVKDEDLSQKRNSMIKMAKSISNHYVEKIWDHAVKELNTFFPISGDEAVSTLITLLCDFNCNFLCNIKEIVNLDSTCHSLEDLQQSLFNGISAMMNTPKIKNNTENYLGEIKKLNYK